MTGVDRDAQFSDFVVGSYAGLVRTAYLLTGDRGHAEDLAQAALLRTFRAWGRLSALDSAESYTRTTMLRLASRWRQRRWRGEIPSDPMPDTRVDDLSSQVDDQARVHAALQTLAWPQRSVLVLRYFADLSEAETAAELGCSIGTVKSRASRGLAALRAAGLLDPESSDNEEVRHDR